MAANVPPSVELAYQQLTEGFKQVGLRDVDPMKAPWSELEPGIARLLGGPLQLQNPQHQAVVLGVSAILGKRLAAEDGGFWAPNRESPDGMIMGFPDAIIMLSPFGAAMDALARAQLGQLDQLQKEVRTALGRARLSLAGGGAPRLGPQDYERLFDPAFLQFVVLEQAKLKEAWEEPVGTLTRNLREALDRPGTPLSPEVKKQLEGQLLGALTSLDPQKGLMQQLNVAGRLVELAAHLVASTEPTRPAPEEFWAAVAFPLLFIGAPESFPPLDEEETQAARQGVDPLFLYLDVVPFQHSAQDEGLLGAFGEEDIGLPHEAMGGLSPLRLLTVKMERIAGPLEKFNAVASRTAFHRFCEHVNQKAGAQLNATASDQVLNEAFALIDELKKVWEARSKGPVALRRMTEAEAAGEPALAAVRKALTGPRLILI